MMLDVGGVEIECHRLAPEQRMDTSKQGSKARLS